MQILRTLTSVDPAQRGASAAIGNFDGVHRGHAHVIALAQRPDMPLGVLTFEPHPREIFSPSSPAFRLMNAEARANRLEKLGVDILFELPFEPALYELSAEAFARDILQAGLGLRHVVVGEDFRFGKGRRGTAAMLQEMGPDLGFEVSVAGLLKGELGAVSSTAIRQALSDGHPRDAAAMLGHWHRIEGPVIHGDKRGRDLGYPTANMALDALHVPRMGVYAVLVDVLSGPHAGSYTGVSSIGVRPMFNGQVPNIETFLFDFKGDLYGADLSIGLVEFLRPEAKFDDLPGLIAQMDRDSATSREILAAL